MLGHSGGGTTPRIYPQTRSSIAGGGRSCVAAHRRHDDGALLTGGRQAIANIDRYSHFDADPLRRAANAVGSNARGGNRRRLSGNLDPLGAPPLKVHP